MGQREMKGVVKLLTTLLNITIIGNHYQLCHKVCYYCVVYGVCWRQCLLL